MGWAQLAFPPAREARFLAWQRAAMWKFDLVAYFIILLSHSINCFSPASPIHLAAKSGVLAAVGYAPALPVLLLLPRRTRSWYLAHREALITCLWLWVLGFMHWGVRNYVEIARPEVFSDRLFMHGFGWLPVMGLLMQLRLAQQVPVMVFCYAVNITRYPEICAMVAPEKGTRCWLRGGARVAAFGVLLPLFLVQMLELRARRLFLAAYPY